MKYELVPVEDLVEVIPNLSGYERLTAEEVNQMVVNNPPPAFNVNGTMCAIYNNELGEFMRHMPNDFDRESEVVVRLDETTFDGVVDVDINDIDVRKSLYQLGNMIEKAAAKQGIFVKTEVRTDNCAGDDIICPARAWNWMELEVRNIVNEQFTNLDEWLVMKNYQPV